MTFFFGFSMIVGGNFKGVGQYEVYDVLAVYDAADECKIAAKRTEYRVGRQYGAAWNHSDRDDDPAAEHLAVSRATAVMLLLMLLCMQTYARLFAKSQDEYLQKRSDDFKRWQAGLLKEEEEIELKEKIVCGIWVFTRLGAVIFLLCALIVFVEETLLA